MSEMKRSACSLRWLARILICQTNAPLLQPKRSVDLRQFRPQIGDAYGECLQLPVEQFVDLRLLLAQRQMPQANLLLHFGRRIAARRRTRRIQNRQRVACCNVLALDHEQLRDHSRLRWPDLHHTQIRHDIAAGTDLFGVLAPHGKGNQCCGSQEKTGRQHHERKAAGQRDIAKPRILARRENLGPKEPGMVGFI